jgi:hypothetical protein
MSTIDVSIIIVNWNTRDLVVDCIQGILDDTVAHSVEVIVVDNGSTDGSIEALREHFPQITVIVNETNQGFAKANNIGIRASQGRFVCLVNSDVSILHGCIDLMCQYMDQHPDVGLLGPQVLNKDLSIQVSCGELPSLRNEFVRALLLDRLLPRARFFRPRWMSWFDHQSPRIVPVLSGCFLMTRREALNEIGPLDERFFIYKEDVDWCKRFSESSWKVHFDPGPKAIHYGGASSSATPVRFVVEMEKANRLYWRKHHGWLAQKTAVALSFAHHSLRFCGWTVTYLWSHSNRITSRAMMNRYASCMLWLSGLGRDVQP